MNCDEHFVISDGDMKLPLIDFAKQHGMVANGKFYSAEEVRDNIYRDRLRIVGKMLVKTFECEDLKVRKRLWAETKQLIEDFNFSFTYRDLKRAHTMWLSRQKAA